MQGTCNICLCKSIQTLSTESAMNGEKTNLTYSKTQNKNWRQELEVVCVCVCESSVGVTIYSAAVTAETDKKTV